MYRNILKLKSISFSIILFIIFSSLCYGQTDFLEGYYITWENDTVFGLIDYRSEIKNSKQCSFKKYVSSDVIEFNPNDIQGYRFVDSKYYVSKKIKTSTGEQQVFVEYLLNGITDLYVYNDLGIYQYIIASENGKLYNLPEEKNRHIGLLKAIFADCEEIRPQLNKVSLSHKGLIKINKDYHNYVCKDEKCIIYEKNIRPTKVKFAPIVGIAISKLSLSDGFHSRFSYDQSINPSYGVQVNIFPPFLNENFSIQLEVLYNENEIYGIYNGYYEIFINHSMLSPSVGLKYSYNKGIVRPTFSAGCASNIMLNNDIDALVNIEPGQPASEVSFSPSSILLKTNLWGGFAQLGINYHFIKKIAMFTNIKYTYCSGRIMDNNFRIDAKTTVGTINFSCGFYF